MVVSSVAILLAFVLIVPAADVRTVVINCTLTIVFEVIASHPDFGVPGILVVDVDPDTVVIEEPEDIFDIFVILGFVDPKSDVLAAFGTTVAHLFVF